MKDLVSVIRLRSWFQSEDSSSTKLYVQSNESQDYGIHFHIVELKSFLKMLMLQLNHGEEAKRFHNS